MAKSLLSPKASTSKHLDEEEEGEVEIHFGVPADLEVEVDGESPRGKATEPEDDNDVDERNNLDRVNEADEGNEAEAFDNYEFIGQEDETCQGEELEEGNEDLFPSTSGLSQQDGQWVDGLKLATAKIHTEKRFICVEFPCIVHDKDKAVAMLGGREGIQKSLSQQGRLELSFRPKDPFAKPAVSNDRMTWSLVLRVRRRKQPPGEEIMTSDGFQYQISVIGVVDAIYTFDNQCDFQYLPVHKKESGENEEILSKILPTLEAEKDEYLSRPVPLFLPPIMYSRREKPCFYDLDNDPPPKACNTQPNSLRKKREHGSHIIEFDNPFTPKEPLQVAVRNVNRYLPNYLHTDAYKALKKLFDQRPIWSKTACAAHLEEAYSLHIKYLLPMMSYCFLTGPWRNMWVRFGYDPRKEIGAKMYQVLDYRVRSVINRNKVVRKRGKETARAYPRTSCTVDSKVELESSSRGEGRHQGHFNPTYMFNPLVEPPYRQMRYQLCDIFEDKIQMLVHQNDGKETVCTEKDGWCMENISVLARDIMNSHVDKLLINT